MIRLDVRPHVWGIIGNLGGGKTLSAVSICVDALEQGYMVVTNINLNLDRLARRFGENVRKMCVLLPPDDVLSVSPWDYPVGNPRGMGAHRVIIVLDEIAEWFDQYQMGGQGRPVSNFLSWLRHSSKQGQDVVIVCQRLEFINKSIRILIDRVVTVDDMAVWRFPVLRIRAPWFLRGFILQRTFDRFGNSIDSSRWLLKRLYFRFYNTAQILGYHHDKSADVYQSSPLAYRPFSFFWIWFTIFVIFTIVNIILLCCIIC